MQPIQRTSCRDQQPSSAAYLAAMIDRRTREYGLSARRPADTSKGLGIRMRRPDAGVLIWVEGDAEVLPEPAAGRHRGMIVVAHRSGQGIADASFIISYPVDTDDDAPRVRCNGGPVQIDSRTDVRDFCRTSGQRCSHPGDP